MHPSAHAPSAASSRLPSTCRRATAADTSTTRSSTSFTGCRHRRLPIVTSAFSRARSTACAPGRSSLRPRVHATATAIPSTSTGAPEGTGRPRSPTRCRRTSTGTSARSRAGAAAPSSDCRPAGTGPCCSRSTTCRISPSSNRGAAISIRRIPLGRRRSTSAPPQRIGVRAPTRSCRSSDARSGAAPRSSRSTSAETMRASAPRTSACTMSSRQQACRICSSSIPAHTSSGCGARTPDPGSRLRWRIWRTRAEQHQTARQRGAGRRPSLPSRWAGEVSIPISPVRAGSSTA